MIYLFYLGLFVLLLMVYFQIAKHYNIVDKPNDRSSHIDVTIRGGGLIFLVAGGIVGILYIEYLMVIMGMLMIGLVSFIDDRISLSNKIRVLTHIVSVTMLFLFMGFFASFSFYAIVGLYLILIGVINAYNFMDGINGLTGSYSLMLLLGLQYINYFTINFVPADIIWLPIIAVVAFLFFNFRRKAVCFAGDVGSITIAFWIIFLLLKLIYLTGNYKYVLFLLVYGLDSFTTIIFRVFRKENIFEAHRSHFYQYLANEMKFSHLLIAVTYSTIQLLVICITIGIGTLAPSRLILIVLLCTVAFVSLRFYIEGKNRLLNLRKS